MKKLAQDEREREEKNRIVAVLTHHRSLLILIFM